MKIKSLLFWILPSLLLASCANDKDITSSENGSQKVPVGVTAAVTSKEFDDATRSTFTYDKNYGMQFKWNTGDELTILPNSDNSTRAIYVLKDGGGTPNASFSCSSFSLSKSARYFAFSMNERETPARISIPDKANITVDYSNQRQVASGTSNTSHLGAYDFLVSTGVCDDNIEDEVHFTFQHLGLTMFITMIDLTEGAKYKKLEVYDSKNVYRKPVRTINLANGFDGVHDNTYAPYFDPEDVTSEAYKQSPRFSLLLGPDTNNNNDNSDDEGITVGSDGKLELFIELPPVDMTDNTFIFTLVPADNTTKPFFMKCDAANYKKLYKAGKAYRMTGTAKEVTTFEVSLKINHDWQLGNTLDKTRATGDPGNDDIFAKPTNLYYVFCVDGKVKQVGSKYVNSISSIPATDWTTSTDKVFDTYKDSFTFSVEDTEKDKTKNVYFVASTFDLSNSFTGISSTTTEEQIQSLVYSIPNVSTTNAELDASQTSLRDLYSTPWEKDETFVGKLTDPYQDVILYHTAAKVDLKWNSATSVMGSTETTNKVSVNNVANENLSLFQPATKNGTTGFIDSDASNNYTVTSTIEDDRQFYGRQVYYLPQFNTYNVTVGTNVQDGSNESHPLVTFSPATTNGFTSWLRWLKNY